ncbi:extracellular superoxide dismutase [Cu-Zn]-like [Brachionichthys hirsutus]|uniref:extracellular superoxide dismutase [Cu-Zn]-like n=1 Tax=Brachionichthys hirsutus TaxID=412623 RepID=UPI0036046CDA
MSAAAVLDIEAPAEVSENSGVQYAACKMRPSSTLAEGPAKGQVLFKQDFPQGILEVHRSIRGFLVDIAMLSSESPLNRYPPTKEDLFMLKMGLHGLMVLTGAILLVLASCHPCVSGHHDNETLYATCEVEPSSTLGPGLLNVSGRVLFKQNTSDSELEIYVNISGFPTACGPLYRAIHIHEYGDLSDGCESTGGHYDPHDAVHPEHLGDLKNFLPVLGIIDELLTSNASLYGYLSIYGRSVVVYDDEDDMGLGGTPGSLVHGNAGNRIACCVIGICSSDLWNSTVYLH